MKSKTRKAAGKASLDPLVRCANCRYWEDGWDRYGDNEIGTCCRFPPVHVSGDGLDQECWTNPRTCDNEWCGEHTPNRAITDEPTNKETPP